MIYPGNEFDRILSPLPFETQRTLVLEAARIVGTIEAGRPQPEFSSDIHKACRSVRGMLVWERSSEKKEAIAELSQIAVAAERLLEALRSAHQHARYQIAISELFEFVDYLNLPSKEAADGHFTEFTEAISSLSQIRRMYARDAARGQKPDFAKRWAVMQALHLYKKYRKDSPTTTVGNDFHGLCGLIWELATGEPEITLERQIKRALSPDNPVGCLNRGR